MATATPTPTNRWLLLLGGASVALLFLGGISELTFVDIDLWHEMALFREALAKGWIPFEDHFAYTPTVAPSVHHEWGTGAIAYLLATNFGAAGIMACKYLLTAAIAWICYTCARRQGASTEVFLMLAPLVLTPTCLGFTTIRAQVFTLFFLALLFLFLDEDRHGRRRWLWIWLPVYVLWLNLHAGFVVGVILLGLYTVEQAFRRQPIHHLVAAEAAMVALILVNPYGWYYARYLVHALTIDRSMITEWWPLWWSWQDNLAIVASYALAVALVLYATFDRGTNKPADSSGNSGEPRRLGLHYLPGLLIVLACAYAGARHFRHLSIFAIAWLCFAPAYLEGTKLGQILRGLWSQQKVVLALFWVVIGGFGAFNAWHYRVWELRVPFRDTPRYPIGAVAYLQEQHFRGNVVTPFEMGAFVSWKLFPNVLVSMDSRMEVAYQPGVLEEHARFFHGQPGWREFLHKYPTDAVLLYRERPVVELMRKESDWPCVYEDDLFVLFAREKLRLPKVDRRGEDFHGLFP
jgi:hypothetical protein